MGDAVDWRGQAVDWKIDWEGSHRIDNRLKRWKFDRANGKGNMDYGPRRELATYHGLGRIAQRPKKHEGPESSPSEPSVVRMG